MRPLTRIAYALGFAPAFLVVLATGVPLAAGTALLVREPARAPAAAPEPVPVLALRPALETYYLLPITVRGGRAAGGIQRLEVTQGDEVSIGVVSDRMTVVSVPGYNVWAPLEAGREGVINLVALEWGRFPVRADGRLVGVLSVRPSWAGPPATR